MTQTCETVSELAVSCHYTVADMRAFLACNTEVGDELRDGIAVAAEILEAVCCDLGLDA